MSAERGASFLWTSPGGSLPVTQFVHLPGLLVADAVVCNGISETRLSNVLHSAPRNVAGSRTSQLERPKCCLSQADATGNVGYVLCIMKLSKRKGFMAASCRQRITVLFACRFVHGYGKRLSRISFNVAASHELKMKGRLNHQKVRGSSSSGNNMLYKYAVRCL